MLTRHAHHLIHFALLELAYQFPSRQAQLHHTCLTEAHGPIWVILLLNCLQLGAGLSPQDHYCLFVRCCAPYYGVLLVART